MTIPTAEQIRQRRAAFRQLHASGCFALPNPWDPGSARYLAHLGFKALATTSSGWAWSRGSFDGGMSLDAVLGHLREMVAATALPVNADFEKGFADAPEDVARHVRLAIDTGIAGVSIEDSSGKPDAPLFDIALGAERIRAARKAIDASGQDVMLIGRAENFFVGRPDIDDAIARLRAYSEAGADCLYAPALHTREQIAAVVAACAPKPVNVLIGGASDFTMADMAQLGVRRVSVGGGLARAAWGGFMRAAQELAEHGRFDGFAGAAPGRELNQLFRA
ncbi:oxaloacetate decarboxylase [Comamonas sp. NLF-1-9]|uniref:isocitrate lyase/PEP mutase family protein n=1 Tax=Comamonas sp. NLF-1-9 TaxID=2853163 RepID=UPI001C43A85C|nr:isocitrate lyase/phosphoenolpyruvate mutase family protein [Comamonas sp. NLF-1-9]QXL84577.1 isocitrate lyase/phosphoenolpyruvate mutase family protein [Comamonas sp. NLF-1-9]